MIKILSSLLLILTCTASLAANNLVRIPFDESTDRPKLAQDTGIPDEAVLFVHFGTSTLQEQLAPQVNLGDFRFVLFEITPNGIVFVRWDEEQRIYKVWEQFSRDEISGVALFSDDKRRQLQIQTAKGFFTVNMYDDKATGIDKHAPVLQAFQKLQQMQLPEFESPGYSDMSRTPRFLLIPYKK